MRLNNKKDISGRLLVKTRRLRIKTKAFFSGILMKLELKFRGIKMGRGCIFNGRAIFFRHYESSILIGNNCRFISDSSTNLAGIYRPCTLSALKKGAQISIGDNCGFSGTVIGAAGKVIIGNDVFVGANVFISDFDWHNVDASKRKENCTSFSPVVIEDNVWIGLNTCILKGVTIGKNSVIGANSVVTKDIPENVVAAGNPCKVIKNL